MGDRNLYKMRTVTRLTGFSPAVLRAWERRHGFLRPERGRGGHRLYTQEDLAVLRQVRQLIDQKGLSIGEISMAGRDALLSGAPPETEQQAVPAGRQPECAPRDGNGLLRAIRDAVVRSAVEMDRDRIDDHLDEAFSVVGAERVIHDVIKPSAQKIGELWVQGDCTIASEHLATAAFLYRLWKLLETARRRGGQGPRLVLSCFPDEQHELGLLVMAYHLSRRGWSVFHLGSSLPFEDLDRACDVIAPSGILLSVTRRSIYQTHKPKLIELLGRRGASIGVLVGGQGAPDQDPELLRAQAVILSPDKATTAGVDSALRQRVSNAPPDPS